MIGCRHPRRVPYSLSRIRNPALSFAFLGVVSLVWLVLRTGTKPSRAVYPCQQSAAVHASAWISAAVVPAFAGARDHRPARVVFATTLSALGVLVLLQTAPLLASALDRTRQESLSGTAREVATRSVVDSAQAVGVDSFSGIFAVTGTNGADDGVSRLVGLMEREGSGFYSRAGRAESAGVVGPDDVVLIKINAQWDSRGGTNTDLVRSLILAVANHPDGFTGEIVVADNGQAQYGSGGAGGSLDWRDNNAVDRGQSITDVVAQLQDRVRVSAYLWDTITTTEVAEFSAGDGRDGYVVASEPSPGTGIIVSYPKFTTAYGTQISFRDGIWDPELARYHDRLVVLNVPVLKSHSIYGVTASVKHYMGVVSDKLTGHNAHRSVPDGGMGTQMAETRMPDLNILDAIWVNARPGSGPSTSYDDATETGVIAASRDPVALDAWGGETILVPAAESLGYRNTRVFDPRRTSRGSFGSWLGLSCDALADAGFSVTSDWGTANVFVE